jgi:hypothetical protein
MYGRKRPPKYIERVSGKGPQPISGMLSRLAHLVVVGDSARSVVYDVLCEHGIRVERKDIKISGPTVSLKLSPLLRNELFLKHGRIIESLKRDPVTRHITRVG